MRYEESIEKLNSASAEELSEKIEKLKNRGDMPEETEKIPVEGRGMERDCL